MNPLDPDSKELERLEGIARAEQRRGASREEIADLLDGRGLHAWNILTVLTRLGFGLRDSKVWMRETERWPELFVVLDHATLQLTQEIFEDSDAHIVLGEDGNLGFEIDLGESGESRHTGGSTEVRVSDVMGVSRLSWWVMLVSVGVLAVLLSRCAG